MYTPLYKVQLYITSFTHRYKLSDFLVQRDIPVIMNPKFFSFGLTDCLGDDKN